MTGFICRTTAMAAFYAAGMFGGHYLLGMSGIGLAVFSLACCCLVLPAQLAYYAISDSAWGTRLYRRHTARKSPKARWVVVQDMRPFGFRIEGRYRTKWCARCKAAGSSYWEVRSLTYVERETRRLSDPYEFDREVRCYASMRPRR